MTDERWKRVGSLFHAARDADPDVPVLKQAKAESARLK
jgi:hypothetical protein